MCNDTSEKDSVVSSVTQTIDTAAFTCLQECVLRSSPAAAIVESRSRFVAEVIIFQGTRLVTRMPCHYLLLNNEFVYLYM